MNAAFELSRARPAPCSLVLTWPHRARAGDATDRWVALVVQRVVRDLVDLEVGPDSLLAPVGEGMDAPETVALRPLDLLQPGPARRLVATNARDPGAVRRQRTLERLDLADLAATVGIALPQVRALLQVLLGDRDDLRADQVQAVALDQEIASV